MRGFYVTTIQPHSLLSLLLLLSDAVYDSTEFVLLIPMVLQLELTNKPAIQSNQFDYQMP